MFITRDNKWKQTTPTRKKNIHKHGLKSLSSAIHFYTSANCKKERKKSAFIIEGMTVHSLPSFEKLLIIHIEKQTQR